MDEEDVIFGAVMVGLAWILGIGVYTEHFRRGVAIEKPQCTEITGKVIAESPYQEGSFFGHSSTPYTFSLRCIDGDSMIFEAYNGSKGKIDSLVNPNFDVTVRLGQSQRPLGGAYKIDQEQLIRISDAEGNRIR